MNKLILLGLIGFSLSCSSPQPLATVSYISHEQYQGTWYEIARLPNRFESDLFCVKTSFELNGDGNFSILNTGFKKGYPPRYIERRSNLYPESEFTLAKMKIQFSWAATEDYYVMDLGENYEYALIGDRNREYLWILSKSKTLAEASLKRVLALADQQGFKIDKLEYIRHDCPEPALSQN